MDFPTALLRDLLDLGASGDGDGDGGLDTRVTVLVIALQAAVPSYRGLSLTMCDNAQPVGLTSFLPTADGEITTSLQLPFAALSPGFDNRSRVVFYATTPGAFVDLAADLGHALHAPAMQAETNYLDNGRQHDHRRPGDDQQGDGRRDGQTGDGQQGHRGGDGVIVLDADLPPLTLVSQLSGLQEVSTINRAVGVMIDQGYRPDDAHAALRRHAAAAGVDTHIYAARLLRTLTLRASLW